MKNIGTLPHVAKDEVWAGDVVPGTELSVEKHPWPTSPPMRKHLTLPCMFYCQGEVGRGGLCLTRLSPSFEFSSTERNVWISFSAFQ